MHPSGTTPPSITLFTCFSPRATTLITIATGLGSPVKYILQSGAHIISQNQPNSGSGSLPLSYHTPATSQSTTTCSNSSTAVVVACTSMLSLSIRTASTAKDSTAQRIHLCTKHQIKYMSIRVCIKRSIYVYQCCVRFVFLEHGAFCKSPVRT